MKEQFVLTTSDLFIGSIKDFKVDVYDKNKHEHLGYIEFEFNPQLHKVISINDKNDLLIKQNILKKNLVFALENSESKVFGEKNLE